MSPEPPPPSGKFAAQPHRLQAFREAARDRFELVGLLGEGSMGAVFHARDRELGRELAVKVLAGVGERQIARFEREAELTARLNHPGIVRVHSAGVLAGVPYISYELVAGTTLAESLSQLERTKRVELVRDAARALGYAHTEGVIHRDVKPANILIDHTGRLRVADFGLATAGGVERLTQTNALLGTPDYMAPEQIARDRELGPPADVWSLGVILYEALTGERPFFSGSIQETLAKVMHGQPTPPRRIDPTIPRDLERVCLKALSTDPDRRYPNGEALAGDLERALAGESVEAHRRFLPLGLLLAAVAVAVALGLALALPRTPEPVALQVTPTPDQVAAVDSRGPSVELDSRVEAGPVALPLLRQRWLKASPGLTAFGVRSMELQGDLLVVLEDPSSDSSDFGLRYHCRSGPVVRTYDPSTLEPLRSIRPHGMGSTRLTTTPGMAATAGVDSAVKLWTLPELEPAGALDGHAERVTALAFSPRGDLLLTSDARDLRLWRVADRQLLWTRQLGDCHCVAFLPDGQGFLVSVKRKREGKTSMLLERWSIDGEVLASLPSHFTWTIAVHSDGERAITSRWEPAELRVWDLGDDDSPLRLERTIELEAPSINDFLLDPAWERVAIIDGGGDLTCLSTETGKRTLPVRHVSDGMLTAIAGARGGLLTAGVDRHVRLSSFDQLEIRALGPPLQHEGALTTISSWATSCEYPLHEVVEANPRQGLFTKGGLGRTSMNDSGAIMSLPGKDTTFLLMVPRNRPEEVVEGESLEVFWPVRALAVLPDPSTSLVALENGSIYLAHGQRANWTELRAATVTDENNDRRPGSHEHQVLQTLALCVDAIGVTGFAAGEEDSILGFQLETGQTFELRGHAPPVTALATARDVLFAGEKGGAVSLFSIDERRHLGQLSGDSLVTTLLPLDRGARLVVGSEDGWVRIWNVALRTVEGQVCLPDCDYPRTLFKETDRVQVGSQLGRLFDIWLP